MPSHSQAKCNKGLGTPEVLSPPCRTTLEIKSLPTPIAIELKVVATV